MNAVEDNEYTQAWAALGRDLQPRAILAISAHWYVRGTRVTAAERPATIHDFGGFPQRLYDIEYRAPGDPALARRVQELLAPAHVALDDEWGLDHGVWSVLVHAFPRADVPVVQLSLDATQPPEFFLALGQKLRPLREDNVLLMASGNVVHNLRAFMSAMTGREPAASGGHDWSGRFERYVRERAEQHDHDALVHFEREGPDAPLAVPTIEHYLPLLPVVGSTFDHEAVTFPTHGVPVAGISMLSVRVG